MISQNFSHLRTEAHAQVELTFGDDVHRGDILGAQMTRRSAAHSLCLSREQSQPQQRCSPT